MRRAGLSFFCIAMVGLYGCHGETSFEQATGKGTVRAINAISTSPEMTFLIEERSAASLSYAVASSGNQFDDLSYNFNFEVTLAGDTSPSRVASQFLDVIKDTDYTFLVTGQLANPTITLWDRPRPQFDEGATNFEAQVGHASAALGDVDVYLADPATAPAAGNALGTLSLGQVLPVESLAAGDYVLTLTAVGDPATVLYQSETVAFAAGDANLMTIFDGVGVDIATTIVNMTSLVSGSSLRIRTASVPTSIRFFHAALDSGNADIYVDDPLTTPVVANHAFGDDSGDIEVPSGALPLTYTTANNIGSILVDTDIQVSTGLRNHVLFVEDSDNVGQAINYIPDLRSVETLAKLAIAQTAAGVSPVDVYLVPSGETIDDAVPILNSLVSGLAPIAIPLAVAGDYDLYVTADDDKTPLASPVTITLALGDIVLAMIRENASPDAVDITLQPLP